jgi:hypothetical protein
MRRGFLEARVEASRSRQGDAVEESQAGGFRGFLPDGFADEGEAGAFLYQQAAVQREFVVGDEAARSDQVEEVRAAVTDEFLEFVLQEEGVLQAADLAQYAAVTQVAGGFEVVALVFLEKGIAVGGAGVVDTQEALEDGAALVEAPETGARPGREAGVAQEVGPGLLAFEDGGGADDGLGLPQRAAFEGDGARFGGGFVGGDIGAAAGMGQGYLESATGVALLPRPQKREALQFLMVLRLAAGHGLHDTKAAAPRTMFGSCGALKVFACEVGVLAVGSGRIPPMKTTRLLLTSFCLLNFSIFPALAGAPTTYQVTGPILSMTDTTIVVKKGTAPWEISRDASTKVTGDLKVGAKVTVQYTMTAVSVDVKPAGKKDAAAAASPK